MDQFADVPFAAWVGFGAAAFIIAILVFRRAVATVKDWRKEVSVPASVVAKRAATYGQVSSTASSAVYTAYFATFELGTGERVEFHLPDAEYGLLVEGDEGTLSYRGARWGGFERKATAKAAGRRKAARSRRA